MLRQCAKISLEIDKALRAISLNARLYVYNITKAAIAPTKYIEPRPMTWQNLTDLSEEANPFGGGTATTVAVNETSAGKAMVGT